MLPLLKKNPWLRSIIATFIFAFIFGVGYKINCIRHDILSGILALMAFFLIFKMALSTDILREKPTEKSENPNPYSFSRFQLWLWTLVIVPCFCLYWGFTKDHQPTLDTTGLILLGISIGTTFTGGVITKSHEASVGRKDLKKYKDSKGFWVDLLMDDNMQFSVGRLQQLVFTLIYVVIYVTMFIQSDFKKYPVFGEEAFYLLGISAGGYLFAKSIFK